MRRVIGLILAGLGTFLIVMAVLLPTWVVGQVVKFPLNEYETATLEASNASYFSPTSLTEKTGVNLEATYTIKGDASAGNSSTAVWNEYSYVYDLTNQQPVQQMTRRFAFDRRTGQLVDCCGASVNGSDVGPPDRSGRVRVPDRHQEADLPGLRHHAEQDGAVHLLRDDGRARHPGLRIRGERRPGAGRHPVSCPARSSGRARGDGHAARVLPDAPGLLRGPRHRGAARR